MPSSNGSKSVDDREEALAYISAELSTLARHHGFDALSYLLDMTRLEAQCAGNPPKTHDTKPYNG